MGQLSASAARLVVRLWFIGEISAYEARVKRKRRGSSSIVAQYHLQTYKLECSSRRVKGEDKVDGDGDDRRGAVEMEHLTICNSMVDAGRK